MGVAQGAQSDGDAAMKKLRIGIASMADMKARTMAVARGERKLGSDEPKLWFTSIESLARVLSGRDASRILALLKNPPAAERASAPELRNKKR